MSLTTPFSTGFKLKLSNNPKLEIYVNRDATPKQHWRWRIYVSGNIMAASSEGYESRQHCIANIIKLEQHIKYLRENNLIK
jgi:uncharacterized protein YegP (UPF0339 family)